MRKICAVISGDETEFFEREMFSLSVCVAPFKAEVFQDTTLECGTFERTRQNKHGLLLRNFKTKTATKVT